MIKFNSKNNKGFTIIETLVAITILMISIAGPLIVAEKGFTAGIYARDEITASYLAQDLLEFVKNVRDNNVLASPPRTWLQNLTSGNSCNSINSTCKLDTMYTSPINPGTSLSTCYNETCRLYTDANGYTTSSSGTTPTKFYRYFYIDQNNSNPDKQAKLVVVVRWNNGTDNYVTYENEIFNIIK